MNTHSKSRTCILLLLSLAASVTLACGSAPEEETPASESAQLPAGHPSTGQGGEVSPPFTATGAAASDLTWTPPEGWVVETPSSAMRRAQYRIRHEAGYGECVVFYFGPGQGGDAQSNALRWAGQFDQSDGRPSTDAMKTRIVDVNGIPVMIIKISGTYHAGSMMGAATEPKPQYMLLGAIAEGPDANWFFKFTGPQATVEADQEAFESMIQSLRTGS